MDDQRPDLPPEAQRHIAADQVAWLTTVTDGGAPAPTPVWFVPDRVGLVVFSEPRARKVHNVRQRPRVSLHFNSDEQGQDIVVIAATASSAEGARPSAEPGYLEKYDDAIRGLGMNVTEFDETFSVRLAIEPISVWLGPG